MGKFPRLYGSFIYKGDAFYSDGKRPISIHQKETNKFMYIPNQSFHQRHTIKNYVWGELKRYVRYNTEGKNFKKLRTRFSLRLRNRGFRKYVLSYSNTSHIRKGINYSIQKSLFLMLVNHLLFRKQRGASFRKGKQLSPFHKKEKRTAYSRCYSQPPPTTKSLSSAATPQSPNTTRRKPAAIGSFSPCFSAFPL